MPNMPLSEITCPINIKDFPQYTGFAPYEKIVAIQVPLVYDQCTLKKCLMSANDPRLALTPPVCPTDQQTVPGLSAVIDGTTTSSVLTFREFRNFSVQITNTNSSGISENNQLVSITYNISFIADILNGSTNVQIPITLTGLTENVILNFPAGLNKVGASTSDTVMQKAPVFRIEILPNITTNPAYFAPTPTPATTMSVYFTLCYSVTVKYELNVQALVPFYGFFQNGRICSADASNSTGCPCSTCKNTPPNTKYPDINFSVFNCNKSPKSANDDTKNDITPIDY